MNWSEMLSVPWANLDSLYFWSLLISTLLKQQQKYQHLPHKLNSAGLQKLLPEDDWFTSSEHGICFPALKTEYQKQLLWSGQKPDLDNNILQQGRRATTGAQNLLV